MQTELSTATPDVASLLATGYRLETPIPDPPPPIDPPDNQGGGNLGDSGAEEEGQSQ